MSEMITADLVDLDLAATTKEAAARSLAERMMAHGRVTDLDGFLADVAAREAQMPTGLDGGIGIPHCRSAHVTEPTLAFGRSASGIDFGAPDGPADLIFLIAAPAGADDAHLTILSSLARRLMDENFTGTLRGATAADAAAALIRGDAPETAAGAGAAPGAGAAAVAPLSPERGEGGPAAGSRGVADGAAETDTASGSVPVPSGGSASGEGSTGMAASALPGGTRAADGAAETDTASGAVSSGGSLSGATGAAPSPDGGAGAPAAGSRDAAAAAVPGADSDASGGEAAADSDGQVPGVGVEPVAAERGEAGDGAAGGPGRSPGFGKGRGGGDTTTPFRIVAVTSCPTGIAHTYMAAESLEKAGEANGVQVAVETQGSAGFTRLDPKVIADADGVIFAHDVPVRDKERFAGKPTVDVGVKAGISRPAELIAEVRGKAARGEASGPAKATPVEAAGEPGEGYGTKLRKWLMSGVSYMVPFVAAGGLLIALGFAIGGYEISDAKSVAEHFAWADHTSWAALLFQVGGLAFSFLVPVLAGYIAYGMADRPGLVPGFVGGAIALTINAGFLGGLIAGLLAGATVMAIQRLKVPKPLRGIMPVVVIPLISSAVVGFLMFLVIGKPIAELQQALTDWLSSLSGANAVILGAILGLMMCFDLGGPLNKVAYTFAVGGLANPNEGSLKVMAAVMAAGMVPPLAMALATVVRGRLFTKTERENGKAAWVLGASFITEGAIPFAAADPLRVIPAAMAGGAVTGGLSMAFECTLRAPHGGIFVVPLIGNPFLYLVAIVAGTLVSAGVVILLKRARKRQPEQVPAAAEEETQVLAAA